MLAAMEAAERVEEHLASLGVDVMTTAPGSWRLVLDSAGYLYVLGGSWRPSGDELRWWLTVAGVQVAHRCRQRAGQPGVLPWGDALDVLADALSRDDWQPPHGATDDPGARARRPRGRHHPTE